MSKISAISAPGSITETGALDFAPLVDVLSKQSLSTYAGSLTTPPCAEGLKFFITTQQLPLDVATFNQIKAVVGFNARFTQNTVGQDNLLAASAKVVAGVEAAARNATTGGAAKKVVVVDEAAATAGSTPPKPVGHAAVEAAPEAEAADLAFVVKAATTPAGGNPRPVGHAVIVDAPKPAFITEEVAPTGGPNSS